MLMLKRLHILFALLLMAGIAGAQEYSLGGPLRVKAIPQEFLSSKALFSTPQMKAPSRAVEVDSWRQMWWGYYQTPREYVGMGTGDAETYWAAIGIPVSQTICQDKDIKAVRFMVAATKYMKDFAIWFSETLPNESTSNYKKIPIDMSLIKDGEMTEIELEEPYAIPAKTLYVGYTFTITEANDESKFPIIINYDGTNVKNALLFRTSKKQTDWIDLAENKAGYGELALQVLLDGEFDHNAVSVSGSFIDVYSLVNGTANATVTLTSQGLGKVSSIDYTETTPSGTSE